MYNIEYAALNLLAEGPRLAMTKKDIPSVAGGTYIRWGRTICPPLQTDMVYNGRMGGSMFSLGGGGNSQCFPDNPQYLKTGRGFDMPTISGAEYQTKGEILDEKNLENKNVPCAVCITKERPTILMIPGNTRCPDGSWTKEYVGYLMAESTHHRRSEFTCLDKDPETMNGYDDNRNGVLLYHTSMQCSNFKNCPPYKDKAELACVVCSK